MHIFLKSSNAIVSHNGQELIFYWTYYRQTNEDLFNVINRYFEVVPKEEQDELFELLSTTSLILRSVSVSVSETSSAIADAIAKFYHILNPNRYKQWSMDNARYYMPPELQTSYGRFNPDTTYLVSDYKGLLDLATLLKPVTVIFGEFITRYKDNTGNDHKEQVALSLLSKSVIPTIPEYEKLSAFVAVSAAKAEGTPNSVVGGLGTSSLAEWALASIIVRRVAPATCIVPNDSLIKKIHGHLENNIKTISLESRGRGGRGGVRLIERTLTKKNREEDDKISVIDSHRLKQLYSAHVPIVSEIYVLDVSVQMNDAGHEVINMEYPENIRPLIETICPDYPRTSPVPSKDEIASLHDFEIRDYHLQFLAVMFKKVIAPKVMLSMNYKAIVTMLVAAQAILHYRGFTNIAHLLTASSLEVDDSTMLDVSVMAVSTDRQKALASIYKYYSPKNKRQLGARRETLNVAIDFIEKTVADLIKLRHHYNSAPAIYGKEKTLKDKYFRIPSNIKGEIADMLILVNS